MEALRGGRETRVQEESGERDENEDGPSTIGVCKGTSGVSE